MMEPPQISAAKRMAYQAVASGTASLLEISLMHPMDVIKTRIQLQDKSLKTLHYTGVLDAFIKMYREEGIGSYYKGVVPPLLIDSPKRCIKFLTYEKLKSLFMFGSDQQTYITYCLSGGITGALEAFLITPFETVKITQQTNRSIKKLSAYAVARNIISTSGFGRNGLYCGLTATMVRNSIYNMFYFGFFYGMKDVMLSAEEHSWGFQRKWIIGLTATFIACYLSTPFDAAKVKNQAQPKGVIKCDGTINTISRIYREEGFRALYKGMVPRLIRVCPSGAILLLAYEHIYEYLVTNYP